MLDLANVRLHLTRYSVIALAIVSFIESLHVAWSYLDPAIVAMIPQKWLNVLALVFSIAGFVGAFMRQSGLMIVPTPPEPPVEGGPNAGSV